mmetsp:Transcript_40346/g.122123  ORF Transcript_40346/g.122123 Transcript_40346/m.122123 type:complete len:211 (+) Transcript_40346:2-634(+)
MAINTHRIVPKARKKVREFFADLKDQLAAWASQKEVAQVRRGVYLGQGFVDLIYKHVEDGKKQSETIKRELGDKGILIPPYSPAHNQAKQIAKILFFTTLEYMEDELGERPKGKLAQTRPIGDMKCPEWSLESETGGTVIKAKMNTTTSTVEIKIAEDVSIQGVKFKKDSFEAMAKVKWNAIYLPTFSAATNITKAVSWEQFKKNRREYS